MRVRTVGRGSEEEKDGRDAVFLDRRGGGGVRGAERSSVNWSGEIGRPVVEEGWAARSSGRGG